MFKKLRVKVKKEEPKYELPDRPMMKWTLEEASDICHFYCKNHEKCPFHCYDEFGGAFCFVEMLLWECKDFYFSLDKAYVRCKNE